MLLKMIVDAWIKEKLQQLTVIMFVFVLVMGMLQSMSRPQHHCEFCSQTYKEVTHDD